MTSRFLRDLLYDKAIEGADAIHSLGEWSEDRALDIGMEGNNVGVAVWDAEAKSIIFSTWYINTFINSLYIYCVYIHCDVFGPWKNMYSTLI